MLHSHLLDQILRRHDSRRAHGIRSQQIPPAAALTRRQPYEVIHQTPAEDPVAHARRACEAKACQDLYERIRRDILEVRGRRVVEEIQHADAGEGLGDDVGED